MTDREIKLVAGALLHDIGKVVYRGGDGRQHSISGAEFLMERADIRDREILDMVRYHHGANLKNAVLPDDSGAYVVYLADNIAAAADRRDAENGEQGFDPRVPLESVFNILNGNHQHMHYRPAALDDRGGINMPADEPIEYDSSFYQKMEREIIDALKGVKTMEADYVNSLLNVLEAYLSYIPSSTSRRELADISLYDHMKMTAAYASCMESYLRDRGITNYKEALFEKASDFYAADAFALVSLDISGVQKFIYTIHSDGALRMLRSRSFYLEILMEHMIDQLLAGMDLTRANLIYSGGGHCYILVPNTEKAREAMEKTVRECNSFFLEEFDVSLFVAAAWVSCCANTLQNKPAGSYAALFRSLSEQLSEQKSHRYTPAQILRLNRGRKRDDTRECRVCKNASLVLADGICRFCASIRDFSADILYKEFYSIFLEEKPGSLPLPGGCYLAAQSEQELRRSMESDPTLVRTYGKNRFFTGQNVTSRLWVGDYTQKGKTTEQYAKEAGGIDRIAVLRADVDNLGHAFVAGFEEKYTTLSRTATFSRQLSLFFKHHINTILEEGAWSMEGKAGSRNATVVYSGGDDIFLVGSWNEVAELAVDISDALKEFSQGTLTISAGIGIYPAKYPLSVAAQEVASLEDASKTYPDPEAPQKNAVTLFKKGMEVDGHTYSWQIFRQKIIGEKYRLIRDFLGSFEERGNAFLYHLLELIRNMKDRINLARFAYVLSRLEPGAEDAAPEKREAYKNFARTMFMWVKNEEDRRQLVTAVLLYVYLHRVREEEKNEAAK